jgi:hypothetical protein
VWVAKQMSAATHGQGRDEKLSMRTRTFGNSGLEVSVIGFGGWPMGRGQYGPFDDDEAVEAVHAARDAGVTLFDTAAVYGWGYGEELMGKALQGWREEIVLVTKGGRRYSTDADNRTNVSDSSADFIREGLDESLQRLQTDYIDLYLIHWPDPTRGFDEPMEVFHEARRAGKILYGGVSNFSVEQMGAALDTFPIATDQVGYSLFDRRAEAEILPFVAGNRMGAMSYGPMAHGLLTGTFTLETEFADDDWRRSRQAFGLPLYEGEHFARNLRVVERLKEIAAGYGKTVAQLSLAWVLSNPAVTVALAGAKKPSEIEEDVGGDWELPGEAKQAIEDAFAAE